MNKNFIITILFVFTCFKNSYSQVTFPVNGIPDERSGVFVFTNATIFTDHNNKIENATLHIKNGKVEEVGKSLIIPKGAIVIDVKGKFIYPSFIEPFSDYGMPPVSTSEKVRAPQLASNTKGAYSWNQAIRPETDAFRLFNVNTEEASSLRKAGFGKALIHFQDGIARGTASLVSLGDEKEQENMIREKAAAVYSFKKGTSNQDYPTSQMGAIALLRQTFLDASWYKNGGSETEFNISLNAWNENLKIPQIFETDDKLESLRADKLGEEFGINFIIKGSGEEYQRISEIKNSGNSFIIPVKFPEVKDVSDPYESMNITLGDLKHWEMAPANPFALHNAGINFAFTSKGLKDAGEFLAQIRKAVKYGLPESEALKACTVNPAAMLGVADKTGALKKGMLADFIICSGNIFNKDAIIIENWIRGKKYTVRKNDTTEFRGNYKLSTGIITDQILRIGGEINDLKASVIHQGDTIKATVTFEHNIITLRYDFKKSPGNGTYILNGYKSGNGFAGTGKNPALADIIWNAELTSGYVAEAKTDTSKKDTPSWGTLTYPNKAFGFSQPPEKKNVLIKNVTVWTNEDAGILNNTDVLVENGKISRIGKGLNAAQAEVIDGTGHHLTSGIIDEHSHIAISKDVNECSHAVTSEVRMGDVIDSDDINIYRQLSGGVTTSQLLHGSCNPIGGQSAIIKLRWGHSPEKMKFENADGFIKFALGENVKQSNWGDDFRIRYPQTRMGVEQVYVNAFTRAKEYANKLTGQKTKGANPVAFRRDLRLEALVEILDKKRFITCHSYQQGEINMLMHVADSMDFSINTFTHILEGYKVADKMKAHGVGASSFSDWWAYKYEVIEAIPYNGAIMHDAGVLVAFNSDDAEMARRLNQEAAKAVKYGGVSEEEALKFVTLNPAKLLHIDNRVGSIKEGKDADVVLWTDHPLSIYAKVRKTFIDGICYYDMQRDAVMQEEIKTERARLINKMILEKNRGGSGEVKKPPFKIQKLHHCIDEE